jgi:hypothetical protein
MPIPDGVLSQEGMALGIEQASIEGCNAKGGIAQIDDLEELCELSPERGGVLGKQEADFEILLDTSFQMIKTIASQPYMLHSSSQRVTAVHLRHEGRRGRTRHLCSVWQPEQVDLAEVMRQMFSQNTCTSDLVEDGTRYASQLETHLHRGSQLYVQVA